MEEFFRDTFAMRSEHIWSLLDLCCRESSDEKEARVLLELPVTRKVLMKQDEAIRETATFDSSLPFLYCAILGRAKNLLTDMGVVVSQNIQEVIKQHHAFYEVQPHYTVLEKRQGPTGTTRRIQAGFDIDVFGIKTSPEQKPGPDYLLAYAALQKLVETISQHFSESCSVEVIPYGSTVIIDTKRNFQQEGMLRISITHRGLDQPAGEPEERALKEIKECLHNLGLRQG
jgi:hypothetical protein